MKTLIFEPMVGGHFTNYLEALMGYASQYPADVRSDIVFCINQTHFQTEQHKDQLGRFENTFQIDASLPPLPHSMAFRLKGVKTYLSTLRKLWSLFLERVEYHQPGRIIIPSGDHLTLAAALFHNARSRALLANRQSIVVLHQGYGENTDSVGEKLKGSIYLWSWKRAPWTETTTVNPVVAEWVRQNRPEISMGLCPDPVPNLTPFSRNAACKKLGLPTDAQYVSFIGAVRERAALADLVRGFNAAQFPPDIKLLIAGKVEYGPHRHFLSNSPEATNLGQQLIVLNRHLSFEDLSAAYHASTVVAPLYHQSHALSANLLKAIKAKRPVLVNSDGYSGYMASRFDIGATCSPENPASVSDALRTLLSSKNPTVDTDQLMEFHSPENFSQTLFGNALPTDVPLKSWGSVFENKRETAH